MFFFLLLRKYTQTYTSYIGYLRFKDIRHYEFLKNGLCTQIFLQTRA